MSLSVGVIIPNIWKNKIHVPNHQPDENYPTKIVDIFMILHVSSHCITFGIRIFMNHTNYWMSKNTLDYFDGSITLEG